MLAEAHLYPRCSHGVAVTVWQSRCGTILMVQGAEVLLAYHVLSEILASFPEK